MDKPYPGRGLSAEFPINIFFYSKKIISKNKYSHSNNRGEFIIFTNRGLSHIKSSDYFAADFKNFLFLIPAFIYIEINAQSGGQHGRSQIFRVITRLLFVLAVSVMFADVAIR